MSLTWTVRVCSKLPRQAATGINKVSDNKRFIAGRHDKIFGYPSRWKHRLVWFWKAQAWIQMHHCLLVSLGLLCPTSNACTFILWLRSLSGTVLPEVCSWHYFQASPEKSLHYCYVRDPPGIDQNVHIFLGTYSREIYNEIHMPSFEFFVLQHLSLTHAFTNYVFPNWLQDYCVIAPCVTVVPNFSVISSSGVTRISTAF